FRWFWEEDPSQLKEWSDALKQLGRSGEGVGTVLRGNDDALEAYADSTREARDAIQEQYDALNRLGRGADYAQRTETKRAGEQLASYDEVLKYVDQEIDLREQANDSYQRQAQAGIDAAMEQAAAEEEKAARIEAAQQQVEDSVTGAYDSMRASATEYATSEDGAL